MEIRPEELKEPPKKIGVLKGRPVFQCRLKGGLFVAVTNNKVIGTGSHRAIMRHIAQKFEPEIEFTELSKSAHVGIEAYALLIPKYEELTQSLITLQDEKNG